MRTTEAVRRGPLAEVRGRVLAAAVVAAAATVAAAVPAVAGEEVPAAPLADDPPPPAPPKQPPPPAPPAPAPPAQPVQATPPKDPTPPKTAPAATKEPAKETTPAKAPAPAAAKAPAAPAKAAAPGGAEGPSDGRSALRAAVEDALGAPVHGRFSVRYQNRFTTGDEEEDETDQDLTTYLDLRVGDEQRDRFSANFHVRTAWDLDSAHDDDGQGYTFSSLADTYDHEFTALLDTAYGTWRPSGDAVEAVRFGRQYEYVAETFHFDGASIESRPLAGKRRLTLRAYGGIPVHFYEASSSGDLVAGVQAAADAWAGGRAALDYAHVEDEFSGYGEERDDLAAAQVWHAFGETGDLHGRFTWLDGPSDVSVRGGLNLSDLDLLVQGSLYKLLESKEQLTNELDPYYASLEELKRYWLGEVRASLGLGEDWQVEVGGYVRELDDDEEESDYNRNTRRFWITPSVDDLVAEGSTLSAGLELWTGDGERIETWVADYSHRFTKDVRASIGTDYSLYDYGPLQDGERTHVRSVYLRTFARLTETLSLDLRYAWERDDEETYHVLSLALGVDF